MKIIFIFLISACSIFAQVQNRYSKSFGNKKNYRQKKDLGWIKSLDGYLGIQAIYTTEQVPFWMRAIQYGSVPLSGPSGSLLASVSRPYTRKDKLFDYGFSLEGRGNFGSEIQFIPIEANVKGRFWVFELKAGRSKDFTGLVDSSLSSGAFAVSGNALGIPKIQFSTPEYYTIPFTGKLFSFKGGFAQGYLGPMEIQYRIKEKVETFFHQKYFYGRFGKPNWRLKLFGGFSHQVMYGNEDKIFSPYYKLSNLETYEYVVFGKTYNFSKIGNALGSIDLGFQYDTKNKRFFLYRQSIYDVGALFHLANLRDGLNGISITNKKVSKSTIQWQKIVLELLYTIDQAGFPWSKKTPSGDEDYYNNYIYKEGWSYLGTGLGNPFIAQKNLSRRGLPSNPFAYFVSSRVMALHLGTQVRVQDIHFTMKVSYSQNYGTFATNEIGSTTGNIKHVPYGNFIPVDQISTYLDAKVPLGKAFKLHTSASVDIGGLYYDTAGLMVGVSKTF